jgi:hypothetical protein
MTRPTGFTFEERKSGEVVIRHRSRVASVLRGRRAATFLEEARQADDMQERMARLTGNYRHGNEHASKPMHRPR